MLMPLPTLFFTPLINLKHRIIGARRYRRSDKPHRCHYSAVTTPLSLHLCHYTSVTTPLSIGLGLVTYYSAVTNPNPNHIHFKTDLVEVILTKVWLTSVNRRTALGPFAVSVCVATWTRCVHR